MYSWVVSRHAPLYSDSMAGDRASMGSGCERMRLRAAAGIAHSPACNELAGTCPACDKLFSRPGSASHAWRTLGRPRPVAAASFELGPEAAVAAAPAAGPPCLPCTPRSAPLPCMSCCGTAPCLRAVTACSRNGKRPASSNRQPAISNQQSATSNPATEHLTDHTCSELAATELNTEATAVQLLH